MATPLKTATEPPPQPVSTELKLPDQIRVATPGNDLDLQYHITCLRSEIDAIKRRARNDLVIGIVATATAVLVLISGLVFDAPSAAYWDGHRLVRASVCIILEVFSFFFLRRYGASPGEIRSYQNEITNLVSKFAALRQAVQACDKPAIRNTLAVLVKTERNAILKKGDSTVDLERTRLETQSLKDLHR